MANYEDLIRLQAKIVPELIETMETRYNILRTVKACQPVGRRLLASRMGLGERWIRAELELLKALALLEGSLEGYRISAHGEKLLHDLQPYIHQLQGLTLLERELEERLGLQRVIVVPGNSDEDPGVKSDMGQAVGRLLINQLRSHTVIAVTGGTTMARVVEAMPKVAGMEGLLVLPARGGLGEEVELQANTIAARLAAKLTGSYRLLHAPDNPGLEALITLSGEPRIKEVVSLLKRADILIHGIGQAEEMIGRRGLEANEAQAILAKGAVGEAFGYYFDKKGLIVHTTPSIGIGLEDLPQIKTVIAAAGGASKARAILAVLSSGHRKALVTDEAAARGIINMLE